MKDRQYTTKELFRRFQPYFKPYWKTLVLDLFCAGLTTLCELVLPMIMRYITNQGLYHLAELSVQTILGVVAIYLALRIVDCVATYYMAGVGHIMGAKIETDMRRDAYQHLHQLSNTYYNNTKVGQIMGRITNDLFDVTEFAHHCPEEFFIAGVKLVIAFIILMRINVLLTLIIFLIVPIMVAVCMHLNFKMRDVFRRQRNQIGELNARIEDSLLGQKVVKAFTNEQMETNKFETDNRQFFDIKRDSYHLMAVFNATTHAFDGAMYVSVLLFGSIFMIKGWVAAGDLVAFLLYVTTLIATIRRIIEFAEQFQRGMTGIERFLQIMDADIEIFDEADAVEMGEPKGEIAFHNVSFEYPDDHNQVFKNLNLTIHPGEKVALVGPSGGGKTTLLYAMASHCAQKGWRVLVSTTTHILRPENGLWAKTDAEIQELWARGSYAVVGSPAPNGKLTAPPEADLAHWMAQADAVFLEADGAKHFPCKAPAEQEPVLLPQSNIVLAVAGLSALGRSPHRSPDRTAALDAERGGPAV